MGKQGMQAFANTFFRCIQERYITFHVTDWRWLQFPIHHRKLPWRICCTKTFVTWLIRILFERRFLDEKIVLSCLFLAKRRAHFLFALYQGNCIRELCERHSGKPFRASSIFCKCHMSTISLSRMIIRSKMIPLAWYIILLKRFTRIVSCER
jgi:hypothetical protein